MSFSLSSQNIRLEGPILRATCRTSQGQTKEATLNLNDCIANDNGHLICCKGGNFMASSQNVTLQGTILRCRSRKIDGSYVDASINLDSCIANMEGSLTCTD